jgi:Uma2 family endonuclease
MGEPRKKATYADLERLPANMVGEILEGELVATPRPAAPHALAGSGLGMLLGPPFQYGNNGPGGWWILDEPELHFGEDVVVPDLAGWRRERMPSPPRVAAFELPPDWVCEVLSRSTARYDHGPKLRIYGRVRVPFFWSLDPEKRILDVFELDGKRWHLAESHGGDDKIRARPFEAVELDLSLLWLPEK